MKKTIPYLLGSLFLLNSPTLGAQTVSEDHYCVHLANGHVDVYPKDVLKSHEKTATELRLTLKSDSVITYPISQVSRFDNNLPAELPSITSFKFNNKFNDNVYTDVLATISDHEITASVGAIGKRLTPSFKVSDDRTQVYADGVLQSSKVSRLRFDRPIVYTATYPGYRKMSFTKLKDEEWSDGTPGTVKLEAIPLTAGQLSTNHPGYDHEGLDKMLDGDNNTFFHSAYGDHVEAPYVVVHLKNPVDAFVLKYTTRPDQPDYCPVEMLIECSDDGEEWTEVRRLTEDDGIPLSGYAEEYTSPKISLGKNYSYLRFTVPKVRHKNRKYFVLAEFSLHKYLGETEGTGPELISPAVYDYVWKPFGHDYEVKVDWLTDAVGAHVPRIDINIENGKNVVDKVNYLKAAFIIDGGGVFPDMRDSVLIKGRGNSTWHGPGGKNPYRLKFAEAVKPFGLTKGKNWVLLANSMNGALLTNAIGMKIARMVGTAGANDIVPVELYINGDYRGNYNLTQHVGLHNNSVDIDETNAVLLELDTYGGDPFYFTSSPYSLHTNIKEPDLEDFPYSEARQKLNEIRRDFDHLCQTLKDEQDVRDLIETKTLARYFLVNELIDNEELKHPKSCFLYREDPTAKHSKYVFGPVWDLDWAYGYEGTYQHCPPYYDMNYFRRISSGSGGKFYNALRYNNEYMERCYYQVWTDFMNHHLVELQEYIDDYYAFAKPSIQHDGQRWYDGFGYNSAVDRFKNWVTNRAAYIYSTLETYDLEEPLPILRGDVNLDGAITMADVVCVYNHLLGLDNETFDSAQADANESGKISVADIVWIVGWAMQAEADATRQLMLPRAEATLHTQRFTAILNQQVEVPVTIDLTADHYVAAQFDVVLPEAMTLEDVVLPDAWEGYQVEMAENGPHHYRVAVYSDQGAQLPVGTAVLNLLVNTSEAVEQTERAVHITHTILVTSQGEDERMSGRSASFDMDVTGIGETQGSEAVRGGDALHVEALATGEVRIYTVDGRLVKTAIVTAGSNRIALPAGVYIVNNEKIVINQ